MRFRSRTETFTLLARPAEAVGERLALDVGFELIESIKNQRSDALHAFCEDQGFPEGWTFEMLEEGARAVIALDAEHAILAMGWMIDRPYFVEEIGLTISPAEGCPYLFGDFVAPAARGKGLQRALVGKRLEHFPGRDAFTLVDPGNAASFKSYAAHGFSPSAEVRLWHWGPINRTRLRLIGGKSLFDFALKRKIIEIRNGAVMAGA